MWLSSINCSGAREIFKFHGIDGKDLLQLTDLDLRVDLKFKRVHDRKYLLRCIHELKLGLFAVIEVFYANDVCRIRISDLETYTFDKLRRDAARFWGLDSEGCVVQDQEGFILGNFPVAPFFDSSNRQQEPVFLIPSMPGQDQPLAGMREGAPDEGEDDLNEDRQLRGEAEEIRAPYLEVEKQMLNKPRQGPAPTQRKPTPSGGKKGQHGQGKEVEQPKPSTSVPTRSPEGARSDDEDELQSVLTLMK